MIQTPRSVTELFQQYLHRQIEAQAAGLGLADPDGQVVPHEAVPMQPIDPRLAWEDAFAVVLALRAGGVSDGPSVADASGSFSREAPPDWPSLVAALEPAVAVAFCVGNFPQMVRNLQPLLDQAGSVSDGRLVPCERPVIVPPALLQWAAAAHSYPQLLVAAGVLRLARRFDEASELLRSNGEAPAAWRALQANEEAALAWHRGNSKEAWTLWQAQKTSVPVLFNRGMAALFLGRPAEARPPLTQAVAQLPETSAWHHLGHLYLALSAASSERPFRNRRAGEVSPLFRRQQGA